MKTFWLIGTTTPEEKEKVKRDFQAAHSAFRILEKYIESRLQKDVQETSYDCPSWAYKQADRNGYNRALQDILKVIKEAD